MGGANFLPDFTIVIQLGLFFVCYFFLKVFFFEPYRKLIELRQAKTTGLKEKAHESRQHAELLKTNYETLMKAERRKLATWLDDEKKKLSDEERHQSQEARAVVGKELKHLRDSLDVEMRKARVDLNASVPEYSSQIASKLVGKKIHVTTSAPGVSKGSSAETTV